MQRYYRDHHILAKAELDPGNKLFTAVIAIKSIIADDMLGRIIREPEQGVSSRPEKRSYTDCCQRRIASTISIAGKEHSEP